MNVKVKEKIIVPHVGPQKKRATKPVIEGSASANRRKCQLRRERMDDTS